MSASLSTAVDNEYRVLVAQAGEVGSEKFANAVFSFVSDVPESARATVLTRALRLLANTDAAMRALGATLTAVILDLGAASPNFVLDSAAAAFRPITASMKVDEARAHHFGRAGAAVAVLAATSVRTAAEAGDADAARALLRAAEAALAAAAERSYSAMAALLALAEALPAIADADVRTRILRKAAEIATRPADRLAFALALPDELATEPATRAAVPSSVHWALTRGEEAAETALPTDATGAQQLAAAMRSAHNIDNIPHPVWGMLAERALAAADPAQATDVFARALAAVLAPATRADADAETEAADAEEADAKTTGVGSATRAGALSGFACFIGAATQTETTAATLAAALNKDILVGVVNLATGRHPLRPAVQAYAVPALGAAGAWAAAVPGALPKLVNVVCEAVAHAAELAVARCIDDAAHVDVADSAAQRAAKVLLGPLLAAAAQAAAAVDVDDEAAEGADVAFELPVVAALEAVVAALAAATPDAAAAVAAAAAAAAMLSLEGAEVPADVSALAVRAAFFTPCPPLPAAAAAVRTRLIPALAGFHDVEYGPEDAMTALPATAALALAQYLESEPAEARSFSATGGDWRQIQGTAAAIRALAAGTEAPTPLRAALRALCSVVMLRTPADPATLAPAGSLLLHANPAALAAPADADVDTSAAQDLFVRLLVALLGAHHAEFRAGARTAFRLGAGALDGDAMGLLTDVLVSGGDMAGQPDADEDDEDDEDEASSGASEIEIVDAGSDDSVDGLAALAAEPLSAAEAETETEAEAESEPEMTAAELRAMYDGPAARILALRRLVRQAAAAAAAGRRLLATLLADYVRASVADAAAWAVISRLVEAVPELEREKSDGAAAAVQALVAGLSAAARASLPPAAEIQPLLVAEAEDEAESEDDSAAEGSSGMEIEFSVEGSGAEAGEGVELGAEAPAAVALADPRVDAITVLAAAAADGRSAVSGPAAELLPLAVRITATAAAAAAKSGSPAGVFAEPVMGLVQRELGALAAQVATARVSAVSSAMLTRAVTRADSAAPFMVVSFLAGLCSAVTTPDAAASEYTRGAGLTAAVALVNQPTRDFGVRCPEIAGDVATLGRALVLFRSPKRARAAAAALRRLATAMLRVARTGDETARQAWKIFSAGVATAGAAEDRAVMDFVAWVAAQTLPDLE